MVINFLLDLNTNMTSLVHYNSIKTELTVAMYAGGITYLPRLVH
jgi:hypothetical protein